jgi:glycine dehydrogenase subunit 1
MSYISLSDKDKKEMLARIGVKSLDELFACIPEEIRHKTHLNLPGALSEPELIRRFKELDRKNTYAACLSFLGAGAYPHFIPSTVDTLSSRGEFVTPYTPYQPEVSQGTLQVIFEFQTLICQLTGMDIANASLYDGATGAAEAVMMAQRLKNKPKVLVARTLHPQYRYVIRTYVKNLGIKIEEVGYTAEGGLDLEDLAGKLDDQTSAFLCQSPNFFGNVEDIAGIAELVHSRGALLAVAVAEALSLGALEAPGSLGADIVTGEGQSFGLPVSFGGPYLGFMACAEEFLRQFPGRIAGQTKDVDGRTGYVLTLSTREQHIRRERATSNICTNQAWCALRATIFLATVGREGLREMGLQNIQKAHYAREKLLEIKGVKGRFGDPVFNEFVCEFPAGWKSLAESLKHKGMIAGYGLENDYHELKNCGLVCVTEVHTKQDIDRLADAIGEALR